MSSTGPVANTHSLLLPYDTHWERATCEQVECEAYLNGWVTVLAARDPKCEFIRSKLNGRNTWTEEPKAGGLIEFRFPPGQPCFRAAEHRSPVRPPLLVRRMGEGAPQRLQRPEDYLDSLHTEVDRVARILKQG